MDLDTSESHLRDAGVGSRASSGVSGRASPTQEAYAAPSLTPYFGEPAPFLFAPEAAERAEAPASRPRSGGDVVHHSQNKSGPSAEQQSKDIVQSELVDASPPTLKRALSLTDLVLFGLGCTVGSGIFLLCGPSVLAAGPAVLISFVLTAMAVLMSALCYAEASAYTGGELGVAYGFVRRQYGDLLGFILASALILEMVVGLSVASKGFANYFRAAVLPLLGVGGGDALVVRQASHSSSGSKHFLANLLTPLPVASMAAFGFLHPRGPGGRTASKHQPEPEAEPQPSSFAATTPPPADEAFLSLDPVALLFWLIVTVTVACGISLSKIVNHSGAAAKFSALFLFIAFAAVRGFGTFPEKTRVWLVDNEVDRYFAPTGLPGILEGAGIIVFAYIGFEPLAQLAEETKGDPRRTLPLAMVLTVLGSFCVYFSVALGILGLVDARAFENLGGASGEIEGEAHSGAGGGGGASTSFLAALGIGGREEQGQEGAFSASRGGFAYQTAPPSFLQEESLGTSRLLQTRAFVASASAVREQREELMRRTNRDDVENLPAGQTTETVEQESSSVLRNPTPLAAVVREAGAPILSDVISVGACLGIFPLAVNYLVSTSRMALRLARDGYLSVGLAIIDPRTQTPLNATLLLAALSCGLTLFPYRFLTEVNSVGTLVAFGLVCLAVLDSRVPAAVPPARETGVAAVTQEQTDAGDADARSPNLLRGVHLTLLFATFFLSFAIESTEYLPVAVLLLALCFGYVLYNSSWTFPGGGSTKPGGSSAAPAPASAAAEASAAVAEGGAKSEEGPSTSDPNLVLPGTDGSPSDAASGTPGTSKERQFEVPGVPLAASLGVFFNALMLAQLTRGIGVTAVWLFASALWFQHVRRSDDQRPRVSHPG